MKPIDISGPGTIPPRTSATAVRGTEPVRLVRLDTGEPSGAGALTAPSAGDSPPIDSQRVAEIRKAIEQDRYPVAPAEIADALIAAGLLLRMK